MSWFLNYQVNKFWGREGLFFEEIILRESVEIRFTYNSKILTF